MMGLKVELMGVRTAKLSFMRLSKQSLQTNQPPCVHQREKREKPVAACLSREDATDWVPGQTKRCADGR